MDKYTLLQLNLHNSKLATSEALNYIHNNKVDLAILQEPYCYNNGNKFLIPALGHMKLYAVDNERFYACIVTNNNNLDVLFNRHLSTAYRTCIYLKIEDIVFNIVGVYKPPPDDLDIFLSDIDLILARPNIDIKYSFDTLIAGDFNCRSTIWHDTRNDANAGSLEEFIISRDLAICNEPDFPPTFETVYGHSNIDMTLISVNLINKISGWRVVIGT